MSSNKKETRKSKEEIKNKFEEIKKSKNINKDTLYNLLKHCDVMPEIIETYLNIVKKEENDLFLKELMLYYPVLPIEICKKFGVKKLESEKDRFFKLIKNLSAIETKDMEKKLVDLLKKEIMAYDEIKYLIPEKEVDEEIKLRKQEKDKRIENKKQKLNKKKLSKIEEDKEDLVSFKYSRWFITYNTEIDYKKEDNEEFLFYHLSNSLITEFCKDQKCFLKRMKLIETIILKNNIFKLAYEKRKKKQTFSKIFEFLCMAITNCEENSDYEICLKPIINLIIKEISHEFMNIEEIKEYLKKKGYKYECTDKKIIIYDDKEKKFIIDDYNKYNFNKNVIRTLLESDGTLYDSVLESNIKFSEYMNKIKKNNDLLIKIIKKFSRSELATSSIKKLFDIEKQEYKELFKELSDNIENYIYFLPYNCLYDTERTFKNPMKVLIDPYKKRYKLDSEKINNMDLDSALKEFSYFAFRKFCFEHEIHHLTTVLLFFLYINEDNSINSMIKELTSDGEIKILKDLNVNDLIGNTNKNIQKEEGNLFELLCYGKIQKEFTLKQLLFISNENNDELDYSSFKKKYEEYSKKDLRESLNEFPSNLLLSAHVEKIKECIETNLNDKGDIYNILNNSNIVSKEDVDGGDIYSLLNDNNTIIVSQYERYNNHLLSKNRSTY